MGLIVELGATGAILNNRLHRVADREAMVCEMIANLACIPAINAGMQKMEGIQTQKMHEPDQMKRCT